MCTCSFVYLIGCAVPCGFLCACMLVMYPGVFAYLGEIVCLHVCATVCAFGVANCCGTKRRYAISCSAVLCNGMIRCFMFGV